MPKLMNLFVACLVLVSMQHQSMAGDAKAAPQVLFTNANVFDGKNEKLATGMSVLVKGNKIAKSWL